MTGLQVIGLRPGEMWKGIPVEDLFNAVFDGRLDRLQVHPNTLHLNPLPAPSHQPAAPSHQPSAALSSSPGELSCNNYSVAHQKLYEAV